MCMCVYARAMREEGRRWQKEGETRWRVKKGRDDRYPIKYPVGAKKFFTWLAVCGWRLRVTRPGLSLSLCTSPGNTGTCRAGETAANLSSISFLLFFHSFFLSFSLLSEGFLFSFTYLFFCLFILLLIRSFARSFHVPFFLFWIIFSSPNL